MSGSCDAKTHMNWSAIQVQDILQVVRLDILYSCRLYHEATTTWKVHLILNFWILFFCFWKNMLWWYYDHQKYVDSEKRWFFAIFLGLRLCCVYSIYFNTILLLLNIRQYKAMYIIVLIKFHHQQCIFRYSMTRFFCFSFSQCVMM